MKKLVLVTALLLSGCATPTVTKEITTEVKVPVSVPCVKDKRPDEVVPLNKTMSKQAWDTLGLDQREKLLLAQGSARKTYGDQLYVATAGCP